MALIIYYPNPLDRNLIEKVEAETIRFSLKKLQIETKPLCVVYNGLIEDDIDLDKVLEEDDYVQIHHVVEGSSNDKRNIATVLDIVALVVTVASGGALAPLAKAGILLGAAIVSGGLRMKAAELDAPKNTGEKDKTDIATNNYSLATAQNEVRPLQPMIIPMGSVRYAPDIIAAPIKYIFGNTYQTQQENVFLSTFTPGVDASNGAAKIDNGWAVMPANYIATGFPLYPIRIATYGLLNKTTPLTTDENNFVINTVRDLFDPGEFKTSNPFMSGWIAPAINEAFPIIIYHYHPSDPFVGRYNCMTFLHRIFSSYGPSSITYNSWLSRLFDGNASGLTTHQINEYFFDGAFVSADTYLMKGTTYSTQSLPSIMPWNASAVSLITNARTWLLSINNGNYIISKISSYPVERLVINYANVNVLAEGLPMSNQVFDFGIGDMSISQRKIGSTSVVSLHAGETIASYFEEDITSLDRWIFIDYVNGQDFSQFVTAYPDKMLMNKGSGSGIINNNDMNQYNFSYYRGKVGQNNFKFGIAGNLYSATSASIGSNQTTIQVQWKASGDTIWRPFFWPMVTISNNNTKKVYQSHRLFIGRMSGYVFDSNRFKTEFLEVRIRKTTDDATDNNGSNISQLSIVDACFYEDSDQMTFVDNNFKYAPRIMEGLRLTAILSDTSTTTNYSALVETKCWVFNFGTETWSWTNTRNPAWWFLYYARGGFYNEPSYGQYSPPYSPTQGWVNYPGHPDSSGIMFGCGLYDSEIDIDKIKEWAFFCEEKELYIDMVLRDDVTASEILNRISNVGRASVSYYSGKLSVVYEDPDYPISCMFGMGNIKAGSFSVEYLVSDPVRYVDVTFTNRDTWESETYRAEVPFSSGDNLKAIEISLAGVTNKSNAIREANILAARQFYQRRTYYWETDIDGIIARRGDLVYLSHDSTQYDYSGRVINFIFSDFGEVLGFKHGAIIKEDISYVSIYLPSGDVETFECRNEGDTIFFEEEFHMGLAPSDNYTETDNLLANFPNTVPEDYTFIAGVMSTTGKIVRISSIEGSDNGTFKFSAVDEDPAMWAYEYDNTIDAGSFDDSTLVLSVNNAEAKDLGDGRVRISWNIDTGDFVQVINTTTGLPMESAGKYSFSGNEAVFDLVGGNQYSFEVRPFAIGTPYKILSKKVKIWLS